jgi:hypothetical protein
MSTEDLPTLHMSPQPPRDTGDAERTVKSTQMDSTLPQPPRDMGDAERTTKSPADNKFNALVSSYLTSNHPHPDAPSNHFIHHLIALHEAGRANGNDRKLLANAIFQRQADDAVAMAIVGQLGILPQIPIRYWEEDPDLALHPFFDILRPLIHEYQGFGYRKPMLFVVWVCKEEGVTREALQRALVEYEEGKPRRRRG